MKLFGLENYSLFAGPSAGLPAAVRRVCTAASMGIVGAGLLLPVLPAYSLEFPSTGDRGAPSRTASGGTRSDRCQLPKGTRLSAMVPSNNVSTFAGEQASLWIHTPAELSGEPAELFVKNAQTQEVVYQQQFPLAALEASRIVEIRLPASDADGKPLISSNQDYFWELAVICDVSDRARDHVVQGFVHNVEMSEPAAAAIASLSLSQQAAQYAAAEVWQETLDIALQLRAEDASFLSELLDSVGLSALSGEAVSATPLVVPFLASSEASLLAND